MKKFISLLLCFIMIFGVSACKSDTSNTSDNLSDYKLSNVDNVTVSTDVPSSGFDEAFLDYIQRKTSGNFMVSPLSFRYALGLLLSGANGDTKAEMLKALNIKNIDEWTSYCNKFNGFSKDFYEQLNSEIESYNENVKQGFTDKNSSKPFRALRVANSVWKREDIKEDFTAEYSDYIKKNYDAEYFEFTKKNVVQSVNAWASEKTEKMIPELLPKNYDTENLAVILMNALYYKNSWVDRFNKSLTKDEDFKAESGKTVKKAFMSQTGYFDYYSDDTVQLVILPMTGGVNMAFVLGDTSNIKEKISKAESKRAYVKIPKMDIETSLNNCELIGFLKENGIIKAFDSESADFSKMINEKTWVDDIIQKTKIKTDEDGVEAAAVTAIMVGNAAMPIKDEPVEFIADRPFSFYIYAACDDIDVTLFAGKVIE